MYGSAQAGHGRERLHVELCSTAGLTEEEKATLAPGLLRRSISPALLDVMGSVPNRSRIIKVRSANGALQAASSVLLTESMFMKHCFGEGNHVGTNNAFYFAEQADRPAALSAMFEKLLETRRFGVYVGLLDGDLECDFRAALAHIPHLVSRKVLESGSIATRGAPSADFLFARHKHLGRQHQRFRSKGGEVHVHEGPVSERLAEAFGACCRDSYRRHAHPGRAINVEGYSENVRRFLVSFEEAVHFYATLDGKVVGVQTFLRHPTHLELAEGGFASGEQTYHAYENIIVESVRYAVRHTLDRVSYGLVSNPAKDRLLDRSTRAPIYLVMFFRSRLLARLMAPYRYLAHRRFPLPYWRPRDRSRQLAL
jgi:hypothetical protein